MEHSLSIETSAGGSTDNLKDFNRFRDLILYVALYQETDQSIYSFPDF